MSEIEGESVAEWIPWGGGGGWCGRNFGGGGGSFGRGGNGVARGR